MIDIRITTSGAVAQVEGDTEAGVEFVDAWVLGTLSVEDSGRITVTAEVVAELKRDAAEDGLSIEEGA